MLDSKKKKGKKMRKPKREQIKKECFQIFKSSSSSTGAACSCGCKGRRHPSPPRLHPSHQPHTGTGTTTAPTHPCLQRPVPLRADHDQKGKKPEGIFLPPSPAGLRFSGQQRLKESSFLANPQLAVTAPNFKKKNAYVFVQIKHTHAARAEPGSLESITRQGGQQKFRWLLQARRSKRKAPAPSPSPPQSHTAAGTCARSASPPRLLASLLACRVLPRDSALCSKHLHADCSFCYKTASPSPSGREEILKTRPNATLDVC